MNKEYKGDPSYPPVHGCEEITRVPVSVTVDPKSTYYDAGGIETIAIIKAKLTPPQYIGYLLGNVVKYATRMNHKGTVVRDAEKLATYSRLLKEAVCESSN